MKILFITKRKADVTSEQIAALRLEEVPAVWRLVKAGSLREIYFSPERPAVVGVLECENIDRARELLGMLPMAAAGLIDFELLSLQPYDQFELLFRYRNQPCQEEIPMTQEAKGRRAVVFMDPKPGKAKELLELTRRILVDVRKANPGLLKVEINTSEEDPNQIILYYTWRSKEDQMGYEASPMFTEILGRIMPLMANRRLIRADNIE
jgi:quinol monooxygenase YgiN